jgi:hypothetical protein
LSDRDWRRERDEQRDTLPLKTDFKPARSAPAVHTIKISLEQRPETAGVPDMHQSAEPRHHTVRSVARRADVAGSASISGAVGIIAVLMLAWGAIVATCLT